ncbi:MAG: hypothetical protein QM500_09780 [Methylococcales bacterium]
MTTQTKCTLTLSGLFILELLPVPFTSIFSLYVTRTRPDWLPGLVERLYEGKEQNQLIQVEGHDSMVTRRKCTISLCLMILLDVITPFTIIMGLYITRRRPAWFKNVVNRLYADKLSEAGGVDDVSEISNSHTLDNDALEKKYIALQQSNSDFAFNLAARTKKTS